jgi:toxin ParE1/3/4
LARYHLTPAAADDIDAITEFTRVTWSLDQSLAYVDKIYDVLDQIAEFPDIGRGEQDFGTDFRSKPVAAHRIYYRVDREAVLIIRILHAAQDPDAAFGPPDAP